jgi:hypothetical protein
MSKRILLIEPDYKNKYPPLGLMKISSFHKEMGDEVIFFKGYSKDLRKERWDRIYISTLFTFYWRKTIDTIKYYSKSVEKTADIFVGGVMATLLNGEISKETQTTIIPGLLNKKGLLGISGDESVDELVPDYSIIEPRNNPYLDYEYPTRDCYFAYATRGCIRKCKFCAVHQIEPKFTNSLSVKEQVKAIKSNFGEKKDLLLLDNNILASSHFEGIIEELKEIGFATGAKFEQEVNGRKIKKNRFVDFNQGVDARLLTKEKMRALSELAINPLRIAFDKISYKDIYIEKVRWAAEFGIKMLSNYILFNHDDTPEDFYERLKINIELNEGFEKKGLFSKIWSFPMRFSPIAGEDCKNRKYVGEHWNKKYLRGIQCILLATHGVVGPKRKFFEKAFGKNCKEFKKILLMPEKYIIYRKKFEKNAKVSELERQIKNLSSKEKKIFMQHLLNNNTENKEIGKWNKVKSVLKYYA